MARLDSAHVLVVGVGGVGSWAAEALVRTGLGSIAIMDDDLVAKSNLNRQDPALRSTLGRSKVEAMRERLLAINPACEVKAIGERYASGSKIQPADYDLVIDAIDSVDCKAELILAATAAGVPILSSMGAALRTDPTAVTVSRFEKVEGDGLAKALRQRFKRLERFPGRFDCVWSRECPRKCDERGSLMTVTATFGMTLAAQAIEILTKQGE